jgi:hypothetical protein
VGTDPFITGYEPLERLFGEERRRTKIGPHVCGERPVLKLICAAVIRAADQWRGLAMSELGQRQLKAIREELDRAHTGGSAPAVPHDSERVPGQIIQHSPALPPCRQGVA